VNSNSSSIAGRAGFTLFELLVSAGLGVVLAGFTITIFAHVSEAWAQTANRLSGEARAKHALDQLALDLSGALFRADGNTWLAVDDVGVMSGLNGPASNRLEVSGAWLRFFTHRRGGNTTLEDMSAPVAVAYRIVRHPGEAANRPATYRLVRTESRAAGMGVDDEPSGAEGTLELGYSIDVSEDTDEHVDGALAPAARFEAAASGGSDAIADHVIGFEIRCHVRDRTAVNGLRTVFSNRGGTNAGMDVSHRPLRSRLAGSARDEPDALLFPEVIDVGLRVLTEEGARVIGRFEAGHAAYRPPAGVSAAEHWEALVSAHSRLFVRRLAPRIAVP